MVTLWISHHKMTPGIHMTMTQHIIQTLICTLQNHPPYDIITNHDVIGRAATFHKVQLHNEPLEEDFLFEMLSSTQRSAQYPPMVKGMLHHATNIFNDPVRSRAIVPRVDKQYTASPNDPLLHTRSTSARLFNGSNYMQKSQISNIWRSPSTR